jgi:hypothetical protein
MNWQAIGVVAEVIGAVAVVISLVYSRFKSATRAIRRRRTISSLP